MQMSCRLRFTMAGTDTKNDEWGRLKEEIYHGLSVVQPFVDQEGKLLDDYFRKMSLA